jgi:hypothetical protein
MNWKKYLKEKDCFKRYAMLEKENRLSYDHVDNWLISLKYYLEEEAKEYFKENLLFKKTNHQLGCMLECYEEVIQNRLGFSIEAIKLGEIASKLK